MCIRDSNNPVKNQFNDNTNTTPPPPTTTTTTNNNSNRYQNNRRSLDGNNSYNHQRNIVTRTNSYEASPKEIQNNRLQRRRSLDNLNRKFNSKQSMQENENAYTEEDFRTPEEIAASQSLEEETTPEENIQPTIGVSGQEQPTGPQFALQRNYLKDSSFESPGSPGVFQGQWTPKINFDIKLIEKVI